MLGIVLMLCTVCHSILAEPQCSKFEYEERTLEKMIRTEILVERVLADINSMKQQTADAVNDMENMKHEMREEFNSMIKENSEKITEWKGQLATKPNVLFLVKDPTTQDPGDGKIIVFNTVMSDTTGSYDKTTGQFTVPVNGSYLFTAQLCLNTGGGNKHIYYALVAANKPVAHSLLYEATHRFCNTVQAVVALEKGQTVHVLSHNTGSTPLRANGHFEWSTFSGILIN